MWAASFVQSLCWISKTQPELQGENGNLMFVDGSGKATLSPEHPITAAVGDHFWFCSLSQ